MAILMRPKAGFFIAVALVFVTSALPALSQPGRQSAPSETNLPSAVHRMMERVIRIAPHVYEFHAPLSSGPVPLANEVLVEQADGLILIDAGKTRGAGLRLVNLIRQVSLKPLRAVILTHWHQDHVLGLGPIVEAWPGVTIVSSRRTLERMQTDDSYRGAPRSRGETTERDQSRATILRGYADEFHTNLADPSLSAAERREWADVIGVTDQRIADEQGTYLVLPTVTFDDHYSFPDSVAPVEARSIGPAHTDGDIVVWLPNQRVVATGDMVVTPVPYGGSNILDYPTTLQALKELNPRIIVPGHGSLLRGVTYVDQMISVMTAFGELAQRLLNGPALSDEQVQAQAGISERHVRMFGGNDALLRSRARRNFPSYVSRAYTELREREEH